LLKQVESGITNWMLAFSGDVGKQITHHIIGIIIITILLAFIFAELLNTSHV